VGLISRGGESPASFFPVKKLCIAAAFRRLGGYIYLGASLKFLAATTFNTPIKSFIASSVKKYTECSVEKSNCLYLEAPEASMRHGRVIVASEKDDQISETMINYRNLANTHLYRQLFYT